MSQKYPIGVETFAKMIEGGFAYVDKTELIYRLTQAGQYFFLSRPRRFGKSLMLSTLQAYFEGRKELFKGLWLGDAEGVDWTPRPVFRLNFVNTKPTTEGLNNIIDGQLLDWEREYGIVRDNDDFGRRFYKIIETAKKSSGYNVVVLVDEYDKVLVNTLHDPDLHEEMRSILKPIFAVLKGADQYIEFAILTGVSRFSKLSIFSDLNNLEDISLNTEYATLCGITEEEVRKYFAPGVEAFAQKLNTDFEGMMQILKDNYDGYHFAAISPDIYNPFSLLSALKSKEILHKWFETGTPTFLVKMMQESDTDIREILTTEADSTSLSTSESSFSNLTALLFQTGYLTIKGYNTEDREYTLGIPNREVAEGLFKCLLPEFSGQGNDPSMRAMRQIRNAVRAGEPEEMLESLQTFLSRIPYTLSKGRAESYFQNNLYIIFSLLGFAVDAEYTTARGRIDILLKTPRYIYVIELKLNGTPEEALRQIEEQGYCNQFSDDPRRLFRIGISFSKETRNIDRWIIES